MKNNPKPTKDLGIINIGIDLGTTNSAIAVSNNGAIELIKSGPGQPEYTPSVFGINKAGNKIVGKQAYDNLFTKASEDGIHNNKAEVKRLMGTAETIRFERLDASLTPEEISAEILKSLKEDVTRKYSDFPTIAAVITIPAYFSSLQAEATKRAGQIAGFKHVVLLQEPIAAAMAYGFDNSENQNWLVYDLGGGTFDVALISSKDGILTVLGHSGDNFLGGKDFDLKIVEEIITPAITEKYNLNDFDRNNKKYEAVFAQLKYAAEIAKIELSQDDRTVIEVDLTIKEGDSNVDIYVSIDFTKQQFEDLISPLVTKTIDLTKKTLNDSGVQSSAVSKIVLVGGPTQIPYIRKSLKNEFNITIDTSVDPLTVVARGACVYGLSQRIPQDLLLEDRPTNNEERKLELRYDAMTAEDESTVAGKIDSLKDADGDYFIQIQSNSGFYSSSKIRLKNGKFFDTVAIEKAKTNTYWLYLFDKDGNTVPVFPDSFSITHGLTPSGAPIPHTISVAVAKKGINNDFQVEEVCDTYFEKGSIPPLKDTKTYKTARKLMKGQDNGLPIKVFEGESSNPENNLRITTLSINGNKLPYDLPEATKVDLTIEIDESRNIHIEAYVPSIELTLSDVRVDTYAQEVDTKKLAVELEAQKERLKQVQSSISADEQKKLEDTINSIETNIKNADNDTDDKVRAERDVRELKTDLDKIEKDRTIPQLGEEFYEKLNRMQDSIDSIEDETERARVADVLRTIEEEGKKAIDSNDKDILIRLNEQLQDIYTAIILKNPAIWIYWLNDIKLHRDELSNPTEADYHITKAEKAVGDGDIEELKRHVRSLLDLLPEETQKEIRQDTAGITK
jgi:molecular chaperone DnaK